MLRRPWRRCQSFAFLFVLIATAGFGLGYPKSAYAGHAENNGGGAIACGTNVPRQIDFAELLDIWEGYKLRHLIYPSVTADSEIDRLVDEAVEKVKGNPEFYNRLKDAVTHMREQLHRDGIFVPDDISISPPSDAINGFFPTGCTIVGAALYNDEEEQLYLSHPVYEKLPPLSKAGLILHEAIYRVFRDWYDATSSTGTRKLVGCLLSTSTCPDIDPNEGVVNPGPNSYYCEAERLGPDGVHPAFSMMLKMVSMGSTDLQLIHYRGHPVATKTTAHTNMNLQIIVPTGTSVDNQVFLLEYFGVRPVVFRSAAGEELAVNMGSDLSPEGTRFGARLSVDNSGLLCYVNRSSKRR